MCRSALFEATHRTYRCQRSCRYLCKPLPREHSKAEDTGSCAHLLEVGGACPSPTLTAGCPAENRARETTPTLPSSWALPDATWLQGVVPTCRVQNNATAVRNPHRNKRPVARVTQRIHFFQSRNEANIIVTPRANGATKAIRTGSQLMDEFDIPCYLE